MIPVKHDPTHHIQPGSDRAYMGRLEEEQIHAQGSAAGLTPALPSTLRPNPQRISFLSCRCSSVKHQPLP